MVPEPDINPDLLKILVCPKCKNDLIFDSRERSFSCPVCRLKFRVRNGIPDMLIADAEET